MNPREFYKMLVETGELLVVYSEYNFSGSWKKDKRKFLQIYEENMKAINNCKSLTVEDLYDFDEEFNC